MCGGICFEPLVLGLQQSSKQKKIVTSGPVQARVGPVRLIVNNTHKMVNGSPLPLESFI